MDKEYQIINYEKFVDFAFSPFDKNLFTTDSMVKHHGNKFIDVVVQNPFIRDFNVGHEKSY